MALQFVAVWPHGCIRQPSWLRPRDSDRVQGQQPEPGGPTVHTAQLVPRVTEWPSRFCLSVQHLHDTDITSLTQFLLNIFVVRDIACLALCLQPSATSHSRHEGPVYT